MRIKKSEPSSKHTRTIAAIAALAVIGLIIIGANTLIAFTGSANVDSAYATDNSAATNPNEMLPDECTVKGISVTNAVTGSGTTLTGDDNGDLLLAGSSTQHIVGGAGDDCIIGGDALTIDGGGGSNNVCIGNQTVAFANCQDEVRQ